MELKSEEAYPKSQIQKIDELLAEQQRQAEEAARLAAEKKALDEKYAAIITLADSQFTSGDYVSAKTSYADALELKSEEVYPKSQIEKIDELLAEQQRQAEEAARLAAEKKALDEKYAAIITLADSQFTSGDYTSAKTSYADALSLKSEESYPKSQIQKIDNILVEQAKQAEEAARLAAGKKALDDKYASFISQADSQFSAGDYIAAKSSYKEALNLKLAEPYPKSQIRKIAEILAEQERQAEEAARLAAEKKALDEKYAAIITLADSQFTSGDYTSARTSYADALELKSEETYPKSQIEKIDELVAEQQRQAEEAARLAAEKKALDDKYASIIKLADSQFTSGDYTAAKTSYADALNLKSEEVYPKSQIEKIDELLAEQKRQVEEAARLAAEKKALDDKYASIIKLADSQFSAEDYTSARTSYTDASSLKSEEAYPKSQIQKIDNILVEQAKQAEEAARLAAEQKALDEKYAAILTLADSQFSEGDYISARSSYKEALNLKLTETYPKSQIKKIADILAEQERQAEEAARLEAEKKALDDKYIQLISEADQYFNDQNWNSALTSYSKALAIKTEESYPKGRIDEIESILSDIKKKEEEKMALANQYKSLVGEADKMFSQEEYMAAVGKYEEALELKPGESYPKNQIKRIEVILEKQERAGRKQKELDEKYLAEITKADEFFNGEDYSVARYHYNSALNLKPKEKYPQEKLDEIKAKLKALKQTEEEALAAKPNNFERNLMIQKEKEYADLIEKADDAFSGQKYAVSKALYEKARAIFQREYPKKQLKEISNILKNQKNSQLSEEYKRLIAQGDEELNKEHYSVAKFYYTKAMRLNTKEAYPQNQLKEIQELLNSKKNQKVDEEYQKVIAKGDDALNQGNLSVARFYYRKAKELKPDEKYPKEKLKMIQSRQSKK